MHKRILIGTVLLLSTATLGVAIAAGESGFRAAMIKSNASARNRPMRPHGRSFSPARRRDRRHPVADEDGDDDEGGEGDVTGRNVPADPNAPLPDNGLFNGKARPKVEVQ